MGLNESIPKSDRGHEQRDINVNMIVLFFVSLVVVGIIVHFIALETFDYLASRPWNYPPPSPLAATREKFAGPRLLVDQALDMKQFRASEESVLNRYDWVDRDHGVVRIPIARAIDLLVERGLPTNVVEQGAKP
jgi:hypothetical protein